MSEISESAPVGVVAVPPAATRSCSCPGCEAVPLVQWQRRPTEAELVAVVAAGEDRRAQLLAGSDPEQMPVLEPLPTEQDTTVAVLGCGSHAISMDLAARIHASVCTAPDPTDLPGCDCTPEPEPEPEPMHSLAQALPDHWQ